MPRKVTKHLISHGPASQDWTKAHEAMKADAVTWSSLAIDGFQSDGLGGLIESRRCPQCGSSISRRTSALEAVETLSALAGVHARSLEAIVDAGAQAQRLKPQAT